MQEFDSLYLFIIIIISSLYEQMAEKGVINERIIWRTDKINS